MFSSWKESLINLHSVLKSRDITAEKDPYSQSYGFPVVKYGYESWTIKKAECQAMALLDCGVGEDSWESLGLQGDQTSQS